MNHYVYAIYNNVNNNVYIGKRSCKCSIRKDKYMGSGVNLALDMNKNGKQNYRKEILAVCRTDEEAYEKENLYISEYERNKKIKLINGNNGGYGRTIKEGVEFEDFIPYEKTKWYEVRLKKKSKRKF